MSEKNILIHFSGGSDSTLASALYAEKGYHVHLVTYDRISFIGVRDYTEVNYLNLCRVYGEDKFTRLILPIGKWHKILNYQNYFKYCMKYRLAIVAMNFSKLAMHWHSIVYCMKNNISAVADGSTPYMRLYPDQNKNISYNNLNVIYKRYGIEYETPVWQFSDRVEDMLYNRGITDSNRIRGTSKDRQVFYAEQFVFALFAKYYTTKHGYQRYEDILTELYSEKLQFIESTVRDWVEKGNNSLAGKLMVKM